jgi:hypothetical protein
MNGGAISLVRTGLSSWLAEIQGKYPKIGGKSDFLTGLIQQIRRYIALARYPNNRDIWPHYQGIAELITGNCR